MMSTRLYSYVCAPLLLVAMMLPHALHARNLPADLADTVEKLTPAVVNISTTQKISGRPGMLPELFMPELPPGSPLEEFKEFFEKFQPYDDEFQSERKAFSLGSGFIIDSSGYIVTNNHVIAEAEEITAILNDEREFPARIIGRDPKTDLALLKIESDKRLPYVEFGDSDDTRVGDWVIAIGNPFGLGGTVTVGIISARARDINAGPFDDFLQTDAAINTGNSGGPMFNLDGEVIGINTAIFSPSGGNIGIGFAAPSSLAQPVIKQLREFGRARRAWLGVKIQTVTEDIAESLGLDKPRGALVVEITPGSPADTGDLQPGDVILSFDDTPVMEMRKFPRLVADTDIGKEIEMTVWRQNQKQTVNLVLGESKDTEVADAAGEDSSGNEESPAATSRLMDMELVPVTPAIRHELGIDEAMNGLLVRDMGRSSKAWEHGLRPDDIIVKVNEQAVASVSDLITSLKDAKASGRNFALLRVYRNGDTHFVTLPSEAE